MTNELFALYVDYLCNNILPYNNFHLLTVNVESLLRILHYPILKKKTVLIQPNNNCFTCKGYNYSNK